MKIDQKLKDDLKQALSDYIDSQEWMCEDNINILSMMPKLLKLQNDKAKLYGRSWCKHGDLSAFFNMERKWDRIQNIMEKAMENGVSTLHTGASSTATETFMDTIVDLGLYSLMWAGFIAEEHPEEFESVMKNNQLG